jgi:hypothetical protein
MILLIILSEALSFQLRFTPLILRIEALRSKPGGMRSRTNSHRLFLVLHRPGDGRFEGVFQSGHGLDEHGPVLLREVGKFDVADGVHHDADLVGEGLRLGPLPRHRAAAFLFLLGGLGLLLPVLVVQGQHAPFLLLRGDLDEDVLRNGGVLAAGIPNRLGKPVEREAERDRGLGFADELGQVVLLTGAEVQQPLEGLGLLDGGQVLAEQVLHQGDLGVVGAVDEDGRNGGEAGLARRGAATIAGHDVAEPGRPVLPADHGLDDPHLADGGRQLLEGRGVHVLAGLRRVGLELGQGHLVKLIGDVGRHGRILLVSSKRVSFREQGPSVKACELPAAFEV